MTQENDSNFIQIVNTVLVPKKSRHGTLVVDLFAGCGGLALGFEAQGLKTIGYEANLHCSETYNKNLKGRCHHVFLTTETEYPKANVVIGGPPCQPFSVVGKQKGSDDNRNGFPAFIAAVQKINPEFFLLENVRGLLYRNRWYLDEVVSQFEQQGFIVEYKLLNAIEYGVPQNRERIIVVGHKGVYKFPQPLDYTVTAGEALGELAYSIPNDSRFLTPSMDKYVANYEKASKCINPRDINFSKPARTLTCRNLAGATGDMQRIKLPDGRRRRLVTREAARLQSFPDWFQFEGSTDSIFNQIGNAVPPFFAYNLAKSIMDYLDSPIRFSKDEIKKLQRKNKQRTLFEQ
ncbi:MAG: DNA cytosine methyltransferase [Thermoguttaceae bacterium]